MKINTKCKNVTFTFKALIICVYIKHLIKATAVFLCLQFTKDVVSHLDSVKIDLRGIILLETEGKQNLLDFSEAGLSEINYADYLEEVTHTYYIT